MYKNSARFQKWSKMCGIDSRALEEARDARIDRSSGRRRPPATPGEEFRRTFGKLRTAICLLQGKLDELADVPGWELLVRRSGQIQAHWAHLSDEEAQPRPSYDDYLAVQRISDGLSGLNAALFDPAAAVIVALIELEEWREKYGESNTETSQPDAEQRAEHLLATCEQIKAADRSLEYLLFEVPAFDTHFGRYYDETEGRG